MAIKHKYLKGARYERKIVNAFRDRGILSFRSAGSHSPIDVVAVDSDSRIIHLIQAKAGDSYTKSYKKKLLESLKYLEGDYKVIVEVRDGKE